MLYTPELAKEYLKQAQEIGKHNAEFENTVGLIIDQMRDSLFSNNHSFRKVLDKQLNDGHLDYLESAGIDVKFTNYLDHRYEYKFTF